LWLATRQAAINPFHYGSAKNGLSSRYRRVEGVIHFACGDLPRTSLAHSRRVCGSRRFFVISGFVITKIVLADILAGRFSIGNFSGRRVRRLFPALITVLVVTGAIGWFVLLPAQYELLAKNLVAGVAFAANLFQLTETGYFAPTATENPLLHLWSLGIEEQFYIFWPPILLLIAGARRQWSWICLLAALSFCAGLGVLSGFKDWSFYSPIARGWELLVGCSVAVINLTSSRLPVRVPDHALSALGLLAIIGSSFILNGNSPFPGPYALLPVVGAAGILISPNSFVNRILLSSRPLVWIGLIRYPLYLWHWPLLSYLDILRNGVPNLLEIWVTVISAIALAALTYRFVELPLRHRENVIPKLSFGAAGLAAMGLLVILSGGLEFRFPPDLQEIARLRTKDSPAFRDHCFLETPGSTYEESCIEPGDKPLLVLWGDSTAAALFPALDDLARKTGKFRLARFNSPGCAPILNAGANSRCDEINKAAFGFVESSHPNIVLLHASGAAGARKPEQRPDKVSGSRSSALFKPGDVAKPLK
jgi:peptidoglycan/LPS O-acetylase OafA/YrhL